MGLAVALGGAEAWAQPCSAPTPACHLENGTELLTSDPRRAAAELLASYQLDERTDTLALYATALALDHRYAHALDTWKRVIVFRDSELEAAREAARTSTGRKRAAARAAAARAQKQSEQAAEAIIQLWSRVGRVRIRMAAGQAIAVSRDGAPVDPAQDVIVNAGRDELAFTRKDGSVERVAVEVAAGAFVKIDAPVAAPVAVAAGAARPAAPREAGVATSAKSRATDAPVASTKSAGPPDAAIATARPRATDAPVASAKPVRAPDAAIATAKPRSADAPVASAKPAAPVEPAAGDEPAIAPRPSVAAARAVGEPRDATSNDARSVTLSRIGIGLAAAAVVAGGVAGSLGYLASRDFDRARDAGCSGDGRCPFGPAADLAQQSNHRARIAQISAASAAALAATGATLWWFGHTQAHRTVTDVALGVGPSSSPGGLSAALSGRF